ncbi:tRNA uridine-5-carboxymethylaminomethyl(34) synthesis GTPase MnmE [Novosphingobium humi]|uniref:tRNA uridine-5-carboxymethylaminomethyl(34) synthesis GTPase MnmE n=1 Tax=Novosphingobium humi TaxID=2282397 RepID=UPI0025AF5CA4|nr:tRNA uridine-5-carboxymethylaminomethyl(34) synthesis GTPase MnmE [Novosphingobium humi]WJS99055.1 tRNA uridine-5-carboxymethylaminomethyl(34) synthesis GTPase MnmE [Novosphingobium humi]
MPDTIFACSSGMPPAAIAVIRISGPQAGDALVALGGRLPVERRAGLTVLRDGAGAELDRALVLWFPGTRTATGEDLAEIHCHGGRAVIAALEQALGALPGLRRAEPGEFTRRAFLNGRMDLAEAEGLGDLLSAETEMQRQAAVAMAGGALSVVVKGWRERVLMLSAQVEAVLDFGDEDDVGALPASFAPTLAMFHVELSEWLSRPRAEALREGFRVVIAGPPNAGKSTLFNALVEDDAAIITPLAGTTRDILMRPVALGGVPFQFLDTAGLRDDGADVVESIGIERAREVMARADLVLWLGPEGEGPQGAWEIESRIDAAVRMAKSAPRHRLSGKTGEGVDALRRDLIDTARLAMPKPGQVALNARQHGLLSEAASALGAIRPDGDLLLTAEDLRAARSAFDRLLGGAGTEDMLDALFGRFCIGK